MSVIATMDPAFAKLASAAHVYQETTEAFASSAEKLVGREKELTQLLKHGVKPGDTQFDDLYADIVQLQSRSQHVGQARTALDDAFESAWQLGKQPGGVAGETFDGAMQAIRHSGIPNADDASVPHAASLKERFNSKLLWGGMGGSMGLTLGNGAFGVAMVHTAAMSPAAGAAIIGGSTALGAAIGTVTLGKGLARTGVQGTELVDVLARHTETAAFGAGMPRRVPLSGDNLTSAKHLSNSLAPLARSARNHADSVLETTSTLRTRVESAHTRSIDAQATAEHDAAVSQSSKDRILAIAQDVRTRTDTEAEDRAAALGGAWAELPTANSTIRIAMPGETITHKELA